MSSIIFVAGHKGMVGSAILRKLKEDTANVIITKTREELDLCNQAAVDDFFSQNKIDQIYLAAAKVGGIIANNNYPADFILQNLQLQTNVINAAHKFGIKKLLFIGSSCIYPKLAAQPIKEEYLLTGPLEKTNEPYAIAKIAGIKLCESLNRQYDRDYRCIMPTNLYGPGDNYHLENSHVIPGLIRRFHEAKINKLPEVVIWGTGTALREFLYVDDLAEAAIKVMNYPLESWKKTVIDMCHINIGSGAELSIKQLASLIGKVVGFTGSIHFDRTKPDGTPRKLLNIDKINSMQWNPLFKLEDGLHQTYQHFLAVESALLT